MLVGATHWGAVFGTLRLVCVQARVVANTGGVSPVHTGTWCSGITSALHAEGPGFNPQCVHFMHPTHRHMRAMQIMNKVRDCRVGSCGGHPPANVDNHSEK